MISMTKVSESIAAPSAKSGGVGDFHRSEDVGEPVGSFGLSEGKAVVQTLDATLWKSRPPRGSLCPCANTSGTVSGTKALAKPERLLVNSRARDEELPRCGCKRMTKPARSSLPELAVFKATSCCGADEMVALQLRRTAKDGIGRLQASDHCKPADCLIGNVYCFNGSSVLSS